MLTLVSTTHVWRSVDQMTHSFAVRSFSQLRNVHKHPQLGDPPIECTIWGSTELPLTIDWQGLVGRRPSNM
eukprot:5976593-Amphidinium_carterae.1